MRSRKTTHPDPAGEDPTEGGSLGGSGGGSLGVDRVLV